VEDRKKEEVRFHSKRETDRLTMDETEFLGKYSNKKFYSITRESRKVWDEWLFRRCQGKVVLDYCCGLGNTAVLLARHGAKVVGIDISETEIRTARARAQEAGVSENILFSVMDAESVGLRDRAFDLIFCAGVLHHLRLDLAYRELSRVLKADGEVICIEAVGHNPFFSLYRKLTPGLRTAWEAKHILRIGQVNHAKRFFRRVDVRFFHLLGLLAVPLRKGKFFDPVLRILEFVDRLILQLPLVRLLAWQMIFTLAEPKSGDNADLAH
jgi:ubiquinone/menaquinone biosynthesis C-methylase UbiE